MNLAVYVSFGVINNLMGKFSIKSVVGLQCITVEGRSQFNVLAYKCLEFRLAAISNHLSANFSATLQNRRYDSLTVRPPSLDLLRPFVRVHIARLTADECLVNFHFAAKL